MHRFANKRRREPTETTHRSCVWRQRSCNTSARHANANSAGTIALPDRQAREKQMSWRLHRQVSYLTEHPQRLPEPVCCVEADVDGELAGRVAKQQHVLTLRAPALVEVGRDGSPGPHQRP
jgi:hypothetical protein